MAAIVHPWLDATAAPIYFQKFPKERTFEEVVAFITVWEQVVRRLREPYGVVTDLTYVVGAPADQRRAFAELEKRIAEQDKKYCAGTALTVPNAITRAIVTGIFWISPPVYPYKLFENNAEGFDWVRQHLAGRRPARPPG